MAKLIIGVFVLLLGGCQQADLKTSKYVGSERAEVIVADRTKGSSLQVISHDPNFIKRGFGSVYNKRLPRPMTYSIVDDPTSSSPNRLVERFHITEADCDDEKHGDGPSLNNLSDCASGRSRQEIYTKNFMVDGLGTQKTKTFRYQFSMYLPSSENQNPKSGYFFQVKQHRSNRSVAPIAGTMSDRGYLLLAGNLLSDSWDTTFDRWHNIVVEIKFSSEADGYLKVWYQGKLLENRSGFRSIEDRKAINYAKYGLYYFPTNSVKRDSTEKFDMVAYFADVKIQEINN